MGNNIITNVVGCAICKLAATSSVRERLQRTPLLPSTPKKLLIKLHAIETKLKQNSFKTVLFQPKQNARLWNVLANRCRYTLFERQTRGGGGAMTYAWRRRSQRWYSSTLL